MQRELNTLEERVLELISLNDSLRKVNRDLVSQLNKKLDECEVLQKKVGNAVSGCSYCFALFVVGLQWSFDFETFG